MSKLAHSCDATMAIIATQNCDDCNGKGTVHLVGHEVPCPCCKTDEYQSTMEALRLSEAVGSAGFAG